jgi:hypothetical protein
MGDGTGAGYELGSDERELARLDLQGWALAPATRALLVRRRRSSSEGENEPLRSLGIRSSRSPAVGPARALWGRVAGLAGKAGSSGRFPAQLGGAGLCPAGSAGARGFGHLPLTFQLLGPDASSI